MWLGNSKNSIKRSIIALCKNNGQLIAFFTEITFLNAFYCCNPPQRPTTTKDLKVRLLRS